jgi:hypothetical protein
MMQPVDTCCNAAEDQLMQPVEDPLEDMVEEPVDDRGGGEIVDIRGTRHPIRGWRILSCSTRYPASNRQHYTFAASVGGYNSSSMWCISGDTLVEVSGLLVRRYRRWKRVDLVPSPDR